MPIHTICLVIRSRWTSDDGLCGDFIESSTLKLYELKCWGWIQFQTISFTFVATFSRDKFTSLSFEQFYFHESHQWFEQKSISEKNFQFKINFWKCQNSSMFENDIIAISDISINISIDCINKSEDCIFLFVADFIVLCIH